MKLKLSMVLVSVFLMLSVKPVFAQSIITVSATSPLKRQYLAVRYKKIVCAGTMYLDMADVSTVKQDNTAITGAVLFAGSEITNQAGFNNVWWIFMKDGKVHYCGKPSINEPEIAFIEYVNFLIRHPEFATLR